MFSSADSTSHWMQQKCARIHLSQAASGVILQNHRRLPVRIFGVSFRVFETGIVKLSKLFQVIFKGALVHSTVHSTVHWYAGCRCGCMLIFYFDNFHYSIFEIVSRLVDPVISWIRGVVIHGFLKLCETELYNVSSVFFLFLYSFGVMFEMSPLTSSWWLVSLMILYVGPASSMVLYLDPAKWPPKDQRGDSIKGKGVLKVG